MTMIDIWKQAEIIQSPINVKEKKDKLRVFDRYIKKQTEISMRDRLEREQIEVESLIDKEKDRQFAKKTGKKKRTGGLSFTRINGVLPLKTTEKVQDGRVLIYVFPPNQRHGRVSSFTSSGPFSSCSLWIPSPRNKVMNK